MTIGQALGIACGLAWLALGLWLTNSGSRHAPESASGPHGAGKRYASGRRTTTAHGRRGSSESRDDL